MCFFDVFVGEGDHALLLLLNISLPPPDFLKLLFFLPRRELNSPAVKKSPITMAIHLASFWQCLGPHNINLQNE